MLDSNPERLSHSLCAPVDEKVASVFTTIAEQSLQRVERVPRKAGTRQPAFYIRAAPGVGKTYLLHAVWCWWLHHRRHGLESVERLDGSRPEAIAPSLELFCISFSSRTACSADEASWASEDCPSSLFVSLRVCYQELLDPTVSWAQFVRIVYYAVADKTLRVFDIGVAAGHILEVCRGRQWAVTILLVDELVKSGDTFDMQPLGSNLLTYGSGPATIRSQNCRLMHSVGGAVLFTSLDETLMTDETASSGRAMYQACRVGYLTALSYEDAVEFGLDPLTKYPNVSYNIGKLVRRSADKV